jgi:hypothetical protein
MEVWGISRPPGGDEFAMEIYDQPNNQEQWTRVPLIFSFVIWLFYDDVCPRGTQSFSEYNERNAYWINNGVPSNWRHHHMEREFFQLSSQQPTYIRPGLIQTIETLKGLERKFPSSMWQAVSGWHDSARKLLRCLSCG